MATKKTKKTKKTAKKATKKTTVKKKTSVKKSVKKSTSKKVSKKTTQKTKGTTAKKPKTSASKRKKNKKPLVVAVGDRYFWVNGGPVIKDLLELRNVMLDISKEQFIYHVNNTKNDFAVWVEEVLQDKKCADNIRKSKTISEMVKNIEKALKEYHY